MEDCCCCLEHLAAALDVCCKTMPCTCDLTQTGCVPCLSCCCCTKIKEAMGMCMDGMTCCKKDKP